MPAPGSTTTAAVPTRDLARLTLLGALVGLPAGVVAFAFVGAVHVLQQLFWDRLPDALGATSPPWYLVLALPVAGAALVAAARRLPGDGGHPPAGGIHAGPVPVAHGPGIALAALAGLATGIVLGPEAPLMALGSVVAVEVTRRTGVTGKARELLGVSGSAGAISTLFGGPLVAGIMLVEAGAGALGAATLLPPLTAAAVAYVLVTGFGAWTGVPVGGLSVPGLPAYDGIRPGDLVLAVVVGVLAAVVMAGVRRLAALLAATEPRVGRLPLLLGSGLAVGGLALLAGALGADPQDVLFSGQASVPVLVGGAPVGVLLVLLVAKALAYAVSMGGGFRGGPIFPAIFLGVALAGLAVTVLDVSPTLAVAAGTAAAMASTSRLLVSAVLFAGLLVGPAGFDAAPAAVLAAVAAWLTSRALDPRR
ncbi:chloride channel protein [Cellulomonas endometrii]|uniref:chloride channel protein n=1 Tax=Cellulomonas endometrii TaxID=3036301 RepID=UPI0024AD60E1|nr:chloride channel protein [Cellulomonas endometrii]